MNAHATWTTTERFTPWPKSLACCRSRVEAHLSLSARASSRPCGSVGAGSFRRPDFMPGWTRARTERSDVVDWRDAQRHIPGKVARPHRTATGQDLQDQAPG